MLNAKQIIEVVKKYGPMYHLHSKEKYLPSSVEWYLQRASLYKNGTKTAELKGDQSLLPTGTSLDETYWVSIPESERGGNIASAVAYVHATASRTAGMTDVQFWFFYPYNGPGTGKLYPLDSSVDLSPFGIHTGDWEHVTLTVNDAGVPQKMYLSQHDGGEWVTLDAKALSKRIHVYSSRNGHAAYKAPGENLSYHEKEKAFGVTVYDIGLRNDTDDKGPVLDCSERYVYLDENTPRWVDFNGRWGPIVDYTEDLNKVINKIPSPVNKPLKSMMKKIPDEVKGNSGPSGPKMKTSTWFSGDKL
jgi:hypothetical protein